MSKECNVKDKAFQRLCSGALPCLLLLGCSAVPMSPATVLAQGGDSALESAPTTDTAPLPESANASTGQSLMDAQLMFELMIAELAGRRGQLDVAMAGYLRAAQRTEDVRVSERASALAVYGQQWAEAEKATQRWLELDPDSGAAHDMLAQSMLRQGKTDEAIAQYRELLTTSDEPDQKIRQLQGVLQNSGDAVQALAVMEAMRESLPDNASVHLALARTKLANNDVDGARESADEAMRLDADNAESLLLNAQLMMLAGEPDDAFAAVETSLANNPNRLMLRLGYARLLVEAGRFDAVGKHLDALYADSDNNADTLLTISMLALDARRMDRAGVFLSSLLDTGEYPDQANFYLGRISDQQQDHDAAIAYYDAVGASELQVPAQIRVAELLGLSGDVDAGRERLRAIAAQGGSESLQIQVLTVESRLLQNAGEAPEAVKVLSSGLEKYPDNPDLLYSRALAADAAGDKGMLVSDLQALIEVEPDNAYALNALGYHYADSSIELVQADVLLVKANRLMPNDPAIMDSLGWLRYRQGEFAEAISLLESAYELFPDSEIAAHLGEVLWLNGDEQEARSFVDKALAQDPEDDRLLQVRKKYIE